VAFLLDLTLHINEFPSSIKHQACQNASPSVCSTHTPTCNWYANWSMRCHFWHHMERGKVRIVPAPHVKYQVTNARIGVTLDRFNLSQMPRSNGFRHVIVWPAKLKFSAAMCLAWTFAPSRTVTTSRRGL